MNSILFGNGFNLVTGAFPEWSELITNAGFKSRKGKESQMPNPVSFEVSLNINNESVLEQDSYLKKDIQKTLKKTVADILTDGIDIELYTAILNLKAEHYLTTNYDNLLYEYSKINGYKRAAMDRTEEIYSLRRYYKMDNGENSFNLWNIHGDVENYKSMMVGYDHYCGNIWKLNCFIKGSYKYNTPGGHDKELKQSLIQRIINDSLFKLKPLISWVDLFFTTNVHIIGLGLPFDEIDLWWILNYRARLLKNDKTRNKLSNKIYFYGIKVDADIEDALTAFGVVIKKPRIRQEFDSDGKCTNYKALYMDLIDQMEDLF